MKSGSPVRFTEEGARWRESSIRKHRRDIAPWRDRFGIVRHVSKDAAWVRVVWDGNSTLSDPIPIKFLKEEK